MTNPMVFAGASSRIRLELALRRPENIQNDREINSFSAVRAVQGYLANLQEHPSSAVVLMSVVAARQGIRVR